LSSPCYVEKKHGEDGFKELEAALMSLGSAEPIPSVAMI
jgi:hypothetical protein